MLFAANVMFRSTDFSGVLMIGPLVASTQVSPRRTGIVAVAATAAAVVGMAIVHGHWDIAPVIRVLGVFSGSVFAIAAARWREARERKLSAVILVADAAQKAILAPLPPALGAVRLTACYRSAASEAVVGGDFYDAVRAEGAVRLIVGDVKGKGLDAVATAARVVGAFRLAAVTNPSLEEVALDVNRCVSGGALGEDFVTAFFLELPQEGPARAVNCGHPAPLVIADRPVTLNAEASPPLGIAQEFSPAEVAVPPGTRVLLFTDGLIEARDGKGAFFPLSAAVADASDVLDDDAFLDVLLEKVDRHTAGALGDDLAMVLVRRLPDAAS